MQLTKWSICCLMIALFLGVGASTQAQITWKEPTRIGDFQTGVFDEGATEIAAYDSASQKLFFTNGDQDAIGVLDLSDPTDPQLSRYIPIAPYGDGVNSVAVGNGILAAAVEADDFDANGSVVFFDASDNSFIAEYEVGVLPDMVTFTSDGATVLSANEGEPNDDYTVDPQGTISIIDISNGADNATVTTLDFTSFQANDLDASTRIFGGLPSTEDDTAFYDPLADTVTALGNLQVVDELDTTQSWSYETFDGDFFAEMNAFSGDTANVDWLIIPALDLSDYLAASFSFENAKNFDGGSLDVLISDDYDTSSRAPSAATWDTITTEFDFSTGGYDDVFSGAFDLEDYLTSNVSIGFLYQGSPGGGNATLWQLDSFLVEGQIFNGRFAPEPATNFEPEYITVSEDNSTAYVSLQENNAIAVVDIANETITDVYGLGFKDHSDNDNRLDASNDDGAINLRSYPRLFGMYQPDAIAGFTVDGVNYVATANEGDAREYEGVPGFIEEEDIEDVTLDDFFDPALQEDSAFGPLTITNTLGDNDGDGDFDSLFVFGGRSFSIYEAGSNSFSQVYDSGDDFAEILADSVPQFFNTNNDENEFDDRSDNKGCEPEAINIARFGQGLNERIVAFIGLERQGGIMVFDVTDPSSPFYLDYIQDRNYNVPADSVNNGELVAGDLGPEDIVIVPDSASPNGETLMIVSNEVSGNIAIYSIDYSVVIGIEEAAAGTIDFRPYPNPAEDVLRFGASYEKVELMDMSGRVLERVVNARRIDVSALEPGSYLLRANDQATVPVMIR